MNTVQYSNDSYNPNALKAFSKPTVCSNNHIALFLWCDQYNLPRIFPGYVMWSWIGYNQSQSQSGLSTTPYGPCGKYHGSVIYASNELNQESMIARGILIYEIAKGLTSQSRVHDQHKHAKKCQWYWQYMWTATKGSHPPVSSILLIFLSTIVLFVHSTLTG